MFKWLSRTKKLKTPKWATRDGCVYFCALCSSTHHGGCPDWISIAPGIRPDDRMKLLEIQLHDNTTIERGALVCRDCLGLLGVFIVERLQRRGPRVMGFHYQLPNPVKYFSEESINAK